jgi:hypothetical protein
MALSATTSSGYSSMNSSIISLMIKVFTEAMRIHTFHGIPESWDSGLVFVEG